MIEAAAFEDGKRKVRAVFKFQSKEAQRAVEKIESHRLLLEKQSGADQPRVLMVFHQANVRTTPVGRRTGERVRIEEISRKDLPLIYASQIAEERIKSEIREADDNLFRKGFVVDVNVAAIDGRPVAYRVTNVHQVIDLPEDDQEAEPVLA